jgi:hypothetical protein
MGRNIRNIRNINEGVVDSYGEVFGNDNLFVVDRSIMPGPVGPNPSRTIAALAERTAQHTLCRSKAPGGLSCARCCSRAEASRPAIKPDVCRCSSTKLGPSVAVSSHRRGECRMLQRCDDLLGQIGHRDRGRLARDESARSGLVQPAGTAQGPLRAIDRHAGRRAHESVHRLGLDFPRIRAWQGCPVTFNYFNFSTKQVGVLLDSDLDSDYLCACVSLITWFPPVQKNGATHRRCRICHGC